MKDIIESLLNDDHEVWLVQGKWKDGALPRGFNSYSNLHIISIPQENIKKNNYLFRYIGLLNYFRKSSHEINKLLEKVRLDIVFLQSTNAAILPVLFCKKKRIPIVYNVQDIFPYNLMLSKQLKFSLFSFPFFKYLQHFAYKNSSKIITISDDMKDTLIEDGIDRSKIKVIYNWGYQDSVYKQDDINFEHINTIIDNKYFNIVYAGNIGVMQNVEIILKVANKMKDYNEIKFHIIGEGVYKENLQKLSKKHNINNVYFWPMQDSSYAPSIYASADINIIPLANDAYRTALPSKTATCVAVEKPIIFAIGQKCMLSHIFRNTKGVYFTDTNDVDRIKDIILFIKNNNITSCDTKEIFCQYFSKSNNTKEYVNVLLNTYKTIS